MRTLMAALTLALLAACGDGATGPSKLSHIFHEQADGSRLTLFGDSLLTLPDTGVTEDGESVAYTVRITRETTLTGDDPQNTVDVASDRTLIWRTPGTYCAEVRVGTETLARGSGAANLHPDSGEPFLFLDFPAGGVCQ